MKNEEKEVMRQKSSTFCDGCFWVETDTKETIQEFSLSVFGFLVVCLFVSFRHQRQASSHNVCDTTSLCITLSLSTVLNIIIVDVNKTD